VASITTSSTSKVANQSASPLIPVAVVANCCLVTSTSTPSKISTHPVTESRCTSRPATRFRIRLTLPSSLLLGCGHRGETRKIQILGFVLKGDTPRSLGSRTRLWTGSKLQVHAATTPQRPPHHHFITPTVATRGHHNFGSNSPHRPEPHAVRMVLGRPACQTVEGPWAMYVKCMEFKNALDSVGWWNCVDVGGHEILPGGGHVAAR